jgi:hypothetical protein
LISYSRDNWLGRLDSQLRACPRKGLSDRADGGSKKVSEA